MNDDVLNALPVLQKGGIILYPTDTIWGIGCDATNAEAVSKIYKLKKREDSKSMIILADSMKMVYQFVDNVPDIAEQLIEVNDKPMTIIYRESFGLPENLIGSDGSVGIRITNDPFCLALLLKLRKPLVSTSANISGADSPVFFSEISKEIINGVDYVVKWRQNDKTKKTPSQIIKLGPKGEIEVIRK